VLYGEPSPSNTTLKSFDWPDSPVESGGAIPNQSSSPIDSIPDHASVPQSDITEQSSTPKEVSSQLTSAIIPDQFASLTQVPDILRDVNVIPDQTSGDAQMETQMSDLANHISSIAPEEDTGEWILTSGSTVL